MDVNTNSMGKSVANSKAERRNVIFSEYQCAKSSLQQQKCNCKLAGNTLLTDIVIIIISF